MPEVSEVAHVTALLRRNILNYKISTLRLNSDTLLFPDLKADQSDQYLTTLYDNLIDSEIRSVGRHGKYFWMRLMKLDQPGFLLFHFGMTGMIKLKGIKSHLMFMENESSTFIDGKTGKRFKEGQEPIPKKSEEKEEWPPKFSKFEMTLNKQGEEIELSFVDPRRLGRIRYLKGKNIATDEDLFKVPPLSLQGPDYSKSSDKDIKLFSTGDPDPNNHGLKRLNLTDFNKLVKSRKTSIKSLLLQQTLFAGIGNWVSDEILYHARLHPSQVIGQLPEDSKDDIIEKLYNAIIQVCETSVKLEGDVKQFPSDWLMIYRWGKRRKSVKTPVEAGHNVDFITIGGRTSCFVPFLQKLIIDGKQTPVAKSSKSRKTKAKMEKDESCEDIKEENEIPLIASRRSKRRKL